MIQDISLSNESLLKIEWEKNITVYSYPYTNSFRHLESNIAAKLKPYPKILQYTNQGHTWIRLNETNQNPWIIQFFLLQWTLVQALKLSILIQDDSCVNLAMSMWLGYHKRETFFLEFLFKPKSRRPYEIANNIKKTL